MQFVHKYHDYNHEIHPGTSMPMPGPGNSYIPVQTSPHLVATFTRRTLPITHAYGEISAETAALVWRELARQFFDGRESSTWAHEPPGAYRHDGVSTATDGEGDNVFFSGSQREFFYGVFDTDDITDCEPQWREVFEAVLTGDADACLRLSEEKGYIGTSAFKPTTDLRAGEMVILDKLLAGGYGEFIVQTPDGPFVTGMGLARAKHEPVVAVAIPGVPQNAGWPENFPWPGYDDIGGNAHARAKLIYDACVLTNADAGRVLAYELEHKAQKPTIARLTKLVGDAAENPPPPAPAPSGDEDDDDQSANLAAQMAVSVP